MLPQVQAAVEGFLRLMWCQTALKGALMTADSTTEVEVGMDIVTVVLMCIGDLKGIVVQAQLD